MPSGVPTYKSRTVRTTRDAEFGIQEELTRGGWEIVERKEKLFGRIELVARRTKRPAPTWAWVGGVGIAAALLVGFIIGTAIPTGAASAADTRPTGATSDMVARATSTPAASSSVSATPTKSAGDATASSVSPQEVVSVFKRYFHERAAANVMVAKAVTKVTFARGVVKVVFDPAAAGVTRDQFEATNPFDNLAKFAATPIAFADETGNRLRPVVDEIKTVGPDGNSLGTFSRTDILALNELSN